MLEDRFWSVMTLIMFIVGLGVGVWLGINEVKIERKATIKRLEEIKLKTTQDSTILYKDSLIMEKCYESLNFKSN